MAIYKYYFFPSVSENEDKIHAKNIDDIHVAEFMTMKNIYDESVSSSSSSSSFQIFSS